MFAQKRGRPGWDTMKRYQKFLGALALAAAVLAATTSARAYDDAQYPDLSGQWTRISPPGMPAWDPSMPRGRGQRAPLTPEYQAVFEANLKELAAGGEGFWPGYACRPVGMPAMMTAFEPMEIVVTPETTHVLIDHIVNSNRRIYTDGRALAGERRAGVRGLFDRQVGRHRRRRSLRHARG